MIIQKYDYKAISRATIEGKRHYALPDGSKVPSVTTILDRTKPEEKRQALANWKKRVGEAQAQQIVTEAANRGTRMHTYLEHYIKTDDMKPLPTNPFAQPSWYMAAEVILKGMVHVDEIWGSEVNLYYSGLYAGTTDCVGVWKGRPAIMDFKQTNKPKKEEWIEDYFMQLVAYGEAHNEIYGTNIQDAVILMCAQPKTLEDGTLSVPEYQQFEIGSNAYAMWRDRWMQRVEQYYGLG
jgi:genome maintenance exonuclease 1